MKKFTYKIKNAFGIHARTAGSLVRTTIRYKSTITFGSKGKYIDAKSIMALLLLDITFGDVVEVTIEGMDEESAFSELSTLFMEEL